MNLREVVCAGCGERTWVSEGQEKATCPYCDAKLVVVRQGNAWSSRLDLAPISPAITPPASPAAQRDDAMLSRPAPEAPKRAVSGQRVPADNATSSRKRNYVAALVIGVSCLMALMILVPQVLSWSETRQARITSAAAPSTVIPSAQTRDPLVAIASLPAYEVAFSPTTTPSATVTPQASATPPATATPTPRPMLRVVAEAVNLRSGPGTAYSVVRSARQGDQFLVTGSDAIRAQWWQIATTDNREAWVSAQLVDASDTQSVKTARYSPPPATALIAAAVTVAGGSPPTPLAPAAQPAEKWVLVSDSFADYPGPWNNRSWWYLWSQGTNNFEWQEMRGTNSVDACYVSPATSALRICRDTIRPSPAGDVTVQWKAKSGGTYRFEWDSPSLAFYRRLGYVGSLGKGATMPFSAVMPDLIEWEMFFWVAKDSTAYHIKVYKLEK